MKEKKSNFLATVVKLPFKIVFSRVTFAILALLVQFLIIYFVAKFFGKYLLWLFGGTAAFGVILTIYILNQPENPSFQLSWIILILIFPALGVFLYLFVKCQIGVHALRKHFDRTHEGVSAYQVQDEKIQKKLEMADPLVFHYATYLNQLGYPVYQHTKTTYFPLGDDMFPILLRDLENATDYIFLEYFIIAKGKMWNAILDILKRKAKEGVEVHLLYDGTCSFTLLPSDYPKELESYGIHARIFNPVIPVVSTQYNNRDHRKIVVIDGKVGYTGGVNLADEYINKLDRFGHWKDTAIRIEGEAVRSLVLLFLENYEYHIEPRNVKRYLNGIVSKRSQSFVIPFGDNPFDRYQVGEVSYFHLLQTAKKYVHIMTPYLILDHEMLQMLCNTALSGVEVKIIMPGIPDKRWIWYLGRTFYEPLLDAGVQIYEYCPGFVHGKMFLSDDEKAVIGTINLDFRSLYLHFEDAIFLYQDESIFQMEKDYEETLQQCRRITKQDVKKIPVMQKLIGKIERIIAPLL